MGLRTRSTRNHASAGGRSSTQTYPLFIVQPVEVRLLTNTPTEARSRARDPVALFPMRRK